MNLEDERESDSENFGARIAKIGVTVMKIWTLKVLGAKWSFHEGSGIFLKFWEWLEGLGTKDRALAKCRNFWGIFGVFGVART
jgi:hypothetical protein